MPVRKRRRKKAPIRGLAPGVSFEEIPTSDVVVISGDIEQVSKHCDPPNDYTGAFVKLAPRIPASERDTWDANAAEAAILKAGARAAILAPDFVPDTRTFEGHSDEETAITGREAVRLWFEQQIVGDDAEAFRQAEEAVLVHAEAEGL